MKEIKIKGVDEIVYHDITKEGLNIYMWVNERINNFYMTYNVKYGSIDTKFKIDKQIHNVPTGIAHFLEHIKFNTGEGTTANDFYNQYGLSINAFTTFDFTSYEVYGDNNFNEGLRYLIEYVGTPYFTEEIIEKEKGIIVEEIKMDIDNPARKMFFGSYEAIFQKDKHQIPIIGTEEDVNKTTLDEINLVYNNFYHPANMFVVITGNFNPYEASSIIKKQLNDMNYRDYSNPEKIYPKEPLAINQKDKKIIGNVEIPKAKIIFKQKKSDFKELEYIELKTHLSIILRSNFGSTSEFKENLLEKELITSLGFNRDIIDDYVIISITVESKYLDEVVEKIIDRFKNLELDEATVTRRRRANIAALINEFDDIEYINSEIQDSIMCLDHVVDNHFDYYNNTEFKKVKETIKQIKKDNFSVIKLLPEEKSVLK